jgi:predicted acetyltransferase
MKIEIKAAGQLSRQEKASLGHLFEEAFAQEEDDLTWSHSDWHVLVWEGEQLASQVGIVVCTSLVGGKPVKLGGIGGVATGSAWRNRGLAGAAMLEAQRFMDVELAVDFGLLVCGEEKIRSYGRLGWKLVARTMLVDQPAGKVPYTGPIMILPVRQTEWPEGEIDLCSFPW